MVRDLFDVKDFTGQMTPKALLARSHFKYDISIIILIWNIILYKGI